MGFAWFHSGGTRWLRVHSCSRWFTLARLVLSGSFGFAWVHSGVICGLRFHSGSRGFTWKRLENVALIRVRHYDAPTGVRVCVRSLGRTKWSSGSFRFAYVYTGAPGGRRDHSGSRVG